MHTVGYRFKSGLLQINKILLLLFSIRLLFNSFERAIRLNYLCLQIKCNISLYHFFVFLVSCGFLTRVVNLKKLSSTNSYNVYFKYFNGFPVVSEFSYVGYKKIFLTKEQVILLTKRYPHFFFIFRIRKKFFLQDTLVKKKIGGYLYMILR